MNLRSLRLERGLSQAALAEQVGTTQQTIARWETGKSQISIVQLRALALVLDSSFAVILGETGAARRRPRPPRHTMDAVLDDRPFGTMILEFPGGSRCHPISQGAFEALSTDLSTRELGQGVTTTATEWLVVATLDGRKICINPQHLCTIRFFADSPQHPIPDYLPRPVLEALSRWPQPDLPNALRRECEALIARSGDLIIAQASRLAIIFSDGREDVLPMNPANQAAIESLEQEYAAIARTCYLRLRHHDGQHHFTNLDHVALIDAPLGRVRDHIAPAVA